MSIQYNLEKTSTLTGNHPTMTRDKALKSYTQELRRTLRPAEWRKMTGLTGKKARFEYAIYAENAGKKGRTATVAEIQDKDLMFHSRRTTAKGVQYTFLNPEHVKYKATGSATAGLAKCTPEQREEAFLELLKQDPALANLVLRGKQA